MPIHHAHNDQLAPSLGDLRADGSSDLATIAETRSQTDERLPRRRRRDDRGEGVISTAIAVLIVAFLGVAMWAGFNAIFSDAANTTRQQVELIGR